MKEIGLDKFESQITPEAYLKELFAHTENGVLFLSRQEAEEDFPRHYRCRMSWIEADLPVLLEEYHNMITVISATVKEIASTDDESEELVDAVRGLIPEEGELQARAWRTGRVMQLEAPDLIVQNEMVRLMEALILCRFCTEQERLYVEGEPLSKLELIEYSSYEDEDGEEWLMAKLRTTGPQSLPVNIHVWSREDGLQPGDQCAFLPDGSECGIKVYPSEEALFADGCSIPVPSMTAMGDYPPEDGKNHEEGPYIQFTGKVLEADYHPEEDPKRYNYRLLVETAEMMFRLDLRHEGRIEAGNVLYGAAWLCGTVTKA